MRLEVLCSINSGAFDKGDIIEVGEAQGESLISAGAAKVAPKAKKKQEASKPKQPEKLVDVKASNEGRAAKRQEAEKAAQTKKDKTAEKAAK